MAISLSAVSLVAIATALIFAQISRQHVAPVPVFEEIRPSLYRLNYQWGMIPGAATVPVASWLIESSTLLSPKSWVLIDTGSPDEANTDAILDGIKSKLSSAGGTLKLIILTHAHGDHTAGLGRLLKSHPKAKVAYHELDAPYITGGAQYNDLEGDHTIFNLVKKIAPPINSTLLPSGQGVILDGGSGDVAAHVDWMSKNILQYYSVPGHTPGMIALYHKPTKSVIAADSFMHVSTIFPFSNKRLIVPGIPLRAFSQNLTQVKESQLKLAAISDATTYFASHDCLDGASAASFREAFVS